MKIGEDIMGKFVFKFASVLKLKEQIEKNIKNELVKATNILRYEEEKLKALKQKMFDTIQEMKGIIQ